MNGRPKLQRPPLALPSYPGYNDALLSKIEHLTGGGYPPPGNPVGTGERTVAWQWTQ